MKASIWIEDGMTQLVLTPENNWEKNVTRTIAEGEKNVRIMRGSFYECSGGWLRQSTSEESLIFKVDFRNTDEHGLDTIEGVCQ